jgi:two-component system alkaline phosphatase synthesis response regulator PhoP
MARARILILEENRQVVDELRDNLELAGFETEVALSTQVAFTVLEERKMDLVILGDSVQAIDTLRKLQELSAQLPVVFLSEQKSKRYLAGLLKAGASAIIDLPMDKDLVIKRVEEIVEKPAVAPPKRRPEKLLKKTPKKKKGASRAS